jgi:hypothetical protein
MSLEGWKALFEIGGVVLLLLTFAFGAGALFVNNIDYCDKKPHDCDLRRLNPGCFKSPD